MEIRVKATGKVTPASHKPTVDSWLDDIYKGECHEFSRIFEEKEVVEDKKTLYEIGWVRGAFPQHDDERHYAEDDVKLALKEFLAAVYKTPNSEGDIFDILIKKAKEIFGDDLI